MERKEARVRGEFCACGPAHSNMVRHHGAQFARGGQRIALPPVDGGKCLPVSKAQLSVMPADFRGTPWEDAWRRVHGDVDGGEGSR